MEPRRVVGMFLVAVASVTLLVGCGHEAARMTARSQPAATDEGDLTEARDRFGAFVATLGVLAVQSEPFRRPDGIVAVLGIADPDRLLLARYGPSGWYSAESEARPGNPFRICGPARCDDRTGAEIADVSGDGTLDAVVTLPANHTYAVVVLGDEAGLTLASFALASGTVTTELGPDPSVENGRLTTLHRTCKPSCAAGDDYRVSWSLVNGVFVQSEGSN